jgi:DNA replication licensing factor MCM6
MPISGQGLMDETQDEQQDDPAQPQLVYVLHPNCAIEDIDLD